MTVGELAARSGVATSTLRFYEREGLIRSRRTTGNQRRYAREMLRRVAFVRTSQRVGISLAMIREALDTLPDLGRVQGQPDHEAVTNVDRTIRSVKREIGTDWTQKIDDK